MKTKSKSEKCPSRKLITRNLLRNKKFARKGVLKRKTDIPEVETPKNLFEER
ncbi:Uncharacterized protein APZ42_000319 [Daphnia magna]|uniref:Uncharacterized protein n=1 Tax=Daphnia magna TaxID=35525 RepID=A0A164JRH3_9CRUS|nr:Uncharacterized protein APZ42_000319 [Daphnia magna]